MDMSPHPSLPASKTQLVVSTGVHSRGCRGTVSEPNPLSALRSKWYRFNSVLRRSCFMFQFGIGTSMPSCNRWLFPAAANILLAFIPPLKSVGFPARQVINMVFFLCSLKKNKKGSGSSLHCCTERSWRGNWFSSYYLMIAALLYYAYAVSGCGVLL
jgi:hypothetical protein